MLLVVDVVSAPGHRPPAGSPVRVELRDVSLADAASVTVAAAEGHVGAAPGQPLATVELTVADVPRDSTVWALVDVDRDGRTSKGDFLTTAAYPVRPSDRARVTVTVHPV